MDTCKRCGGNNQPINKKTGFHIGATAKKDSQFCTAFKHGQTAVQVGSLSLKANKQAFGWHGFKGANGQQTSYKGKGGKKAKRANTRFNKRHTALQQAQEQAHQLNLELRGGAKAATYQEPVSAKEDLFDAINSVDIAGKLIREKGYKEAIAELQEVKKAIDRAIKKIK